MLSKHFFGYFDFIIEGKKYYSKSHKKEAKKKE